MTATIATAIHCRYCGKQLRSNKALIGHEIGAHEQSRSGKGNGPWYEPLELTVTQTARITEHIVQPYKEEEFYPNLLFRGAVPAGRMKAFYNYFTAAMETEMKSVNELTIRVRGGMHGWDQVSELAHLAGIHQSGAYVETTVVKRTLNVMMARLLAAPDVLMRTPHLREYIEFLKTSRGYKAMPLTSIPRWSPNARGINSWRYRYEHSDKLYIPQNWPFLSTETPDDIEGMDILQAVEAAVPKNIPYQIREDLCQDLIVAVLSGQAELRNIRDAVKAVAKAAFKAFPMKYGNLSLESRLFEDGATLGARLSKHMDSVGMCSRCETTNDDLQSGMCPRCWDVTERQLRADAQPSAMYLPPDHKHRRRSDDFETEWQRLTDATIPDWDVSRWSQWSDDEVKNGPVIHVSKPKFKKRDEDEFIVGPRRTRTTLARGGGTRPTEHIDWVYKGGSRHIRPKGDEWEVNHPDVHSIEDT